MALKRNEDRPILQRDGSVGAFDVQRAADALLRQGIKPSVAAIRQHLGGSKQSSPPLHCDSSQLREQVPTPAGDTFSEVTV